MSQDIPQTSTEPVQTPPFVIEEIGVDRVEDSLEMFKNYMLFYKFDQPIEKIREFITRRLQTGSKIFLAYLTPEQQDGEGESVNEKRKVIGLCQLYPLWSTPALEENWVLNDLYVDSEYRSLHIGRSLIKHALEYGDKSGAYSMEIGTRVNNHRGQHLYPKMGCVEYTRYGDKIRYAYKYDRAKSKHYPTYYE